MSALDEDQIEDRRDVAALRYHDMLTARRITLDTYVSFMRDLHLWAESKRASRGAGLATDRSAKPGKRVRFPPTRPRPRRLTSD